MNWSSDSTAGSPWTSSKSRSDDAVVVFQPHSLGRLLDHLPQFSVGERHQHLVALKDLPEAAHRRDQAQVVRAGSQDDDVACRRDPEPRQTVPRRTAGSGSGRSARTALRTARSPARPAARSRHRGSVGRLAGFARRAASCSLDRGTVSLGIAGDAGAPPGDRPPAPAEGGNATLGLPSIALRSAGREGFPGGSEVDGRSRRPRRRPGTDPARSTSGSRRPAGSSRACSGTATLVLLAQADVGTLGIGRVRAPGRGRTRPGRHPVARGPSCTREFA